MSVLGDRQQEHTRTTSRLSWRLMLVAEVSLTMPILVAATDIVTSVIAGLILGQNLYGAWIAVVLTVAALGGVLARSRLR
jgi:hypothetical protein